MLWRIEYLPFLLDAAFPVLQVSVVLLAQHFATLQMLSVVIVDLQALPPPSPQGETVLLFSQLALQGWALLQCRNQTTEKMIQNTN